MKSAENDKNRNSVLLQVDEAHLIEMRRHLHRHPELSGYETQTVRFIADELDSAGIRFEIVDKGGVMAWIRGTGDTSVAASAGTPVLTQAWIRDSGDVQWDSPSGREEEASSCRSVLLRADMDALPVQENRQNLKREKEVISGIDGAAHVCGHDAHTAMLLSAAAMLNKNRALFRGTVYLCFERAEENGGPDQSYGYRPLMRWLEERKAVPDTCFALHVRPGLACGNLSAEPGPVYAGSFGFSIRLKGRGGHGSRPDEANNPLDCFTSFYQALQSILLRNFSPFERITFSIPQVHMGETMNVIPEELFFAGTARSFGKESLLKFRDVFYRHLRFCCDAFGCTYEEGLCWLEDPLINRQEDAARARRVAERIGPGVYREAPPTLGSETFAHYTAKFGGAIGFLGIDNAELGSGAPIHSPEFDLDEGALAVGARTLAGFALDALS